MWYVEQTWSQHGLCVYVSFSILSLLSRPFSVSLTRKAVSGSEPVTNISLSVSLCIFVGFKGMGNYKTERTRETTTRDAVTELGSVVHTGQVCHTRSSTGVWCVACGVWCVVGKTIVLEIS